MMWFILYVITKTNLLKRLELHMNSEKLLSHLKREEGFSSTPYKDSKGLWTIGYGTLIDKNGGGLSKIEAERLLESRVQAKYAALCGIFPQFQNLPEIIKLALVAMAYQMGVKGLLKFKNTLSFIWEREYMRAAQEALDSKWYREDSPSRALRVARMIGSAE